MKTINLGELKCEMTPSDVLAAAKTAAKTGHDFALLTVGGASCYIAALPASRDLQAFCQAIGLRPAFTVASAPGGVRAHLTGKHPLDTSKP